MLKVVSVVRITPVPAGTFAVVMSEIDPDNIDSMDANGNIRREYWSDFKIYKRLANAKKAKEKIVNQGWNDWLVASGISNLN